jgi:hypothetical protein
MKIFSNGFNASRFLMYRVGTTDIYPITRKVDQKCLGKNTNQLQGKNYKVKIQTKYKRE